MIFSISIEMDERLRISINFSLNWLPKVYKTKDITIKAYNCFMK